MTDVVSRFAGHGAQSLRRPGGNSARCAQEEHGESGGARMGGSAGTMQTTVIGEPQCRHRNECGTEGLSEAAPPELEAGGEIGAADGVCSSARAVARFSAR